MLEPDAFLSLQHAKCLFNLKIKNTDREYNIRYCNNVREMAPPPL